MYGGLDKGGGGVVGSGADPFLSSSTHEQNVDDIVDSAAGDETICCQEEDGTKAFLSARISPVTGEVQWVKCYDEGAVMRRTLGMNLMTSMLHDADRNDAYERAISAIIRDFCEKHGRAPTVLDIGTGTGLLAMLAVKHGAGYVIACEMFEAMAEVAREVIAANGLSDQILVVTAKSSEIDSLPFAPDILISELLDSALLGEGILLSHSDAIQRLMDTTLTPDDTVGSMNDCSASAGSPPVADIEDSQSCRQRVVPYGGRVYATAVSGSQIRDMCRVQGLEGHLGGARPWRLTALDTLDSSGSGSGDSSSSAHSNSHSSCGGGSKMIPVHWPEQACPLSSCKDPLCPLSHCLSAPTEMMNFEFFHRHNPSESCFQQTISVTKAGSISGILLWWTVDLLSPELDPDRTVSYSTQPGAQNWQDHWQQVIFPLPVDHACSEGDEFELTSAHDGVHMWLELKPIKKRKLTGYEVVSPLILPNDAYFPPQLCECGWHILHNSERLQMLNDSRRMHVWEVGIQALVETLLSTEAGTQQTAGSIIDLSDGSILALIAAMAVQRQKQKQKQKQKHGEVVQDQDRADRGGGLQVLSLERKDFSHLFSTQLCVGNALQDTLEVMDFESWQELKEEWLAAPHSTSRGNKVEHDIGDNLHIRAIISECFYYQLHAQPIHSALSFYFSLRELAATAVATADASERVLVCPAAARVMVAAFELTNLQVNHGMAGNPCGFVHSPLDLAQAGWQDHWFPYKLGMYAKRLLTTPVCVSRLDYQALFDTNEASAASTDQQTKQHSTHTPMDVIASGTCHCVAMWIDLEVLPDVHISYWADEGTRGTEECNFPPYLKTNVKFFEAQQLTDGSGGSGGGVVGTEVIAGSVINCTSELVLDSALINLHFEF